MNCILMDIQKFLKKLETGQMEIEAGQWELHKDIINLKNSVQGLKDLKADLQLMRKHGLEQTELINKLHCKLSMMEDISDNKDHWSTSLSSSQLIQNKFFNCASVPKNREKVRHHSKTLLRSSKIIGHRFQDSISKRQSMMKFKPKNEKQIIMSKDERQKALDNSTQPLKRLKLQNSTQSPPKPPSSNLGILQRYLKDSVKYIKKTTPQKSKTTEQVLQCEPFDESPKEKISQQDKSKASNRVASANPEKYDCMTCSEKLEFEDDFPSHERIHHNTKRSYSCDVCKTCFCKNLLKKREKVHQKVSKCFRCKSLLKKHRKVHQKIPKYFRDKSILKKHKKVHQKIPKYFRGFRCSYCDKVCKSPEKLTAHLKNCRIITRAHCRKK